MFSFRGCILGLVALLICATAGGASEMRTHTEPGLGDYTAPFYPDGSYRNDVESPSEFLGFELGAHPAQYEEIVGYFRYLSDNFANVGFVHYATSYEGRELVYITITSDDNARRLREIRQNIAKRYGRELIARGYTYREVGEQLFISTKTVENHMSAVLRKLQLSNRRELTRWAQDRDLI